MFCSNDIKLHQGSIDEWEFLTKHIGGLLVPPLPKDWNWKGKGKGKDKGGEQKNAEQEAAETAHYKRFLPENQVSSERSKRALTTTLCGVTDDTFKTFSDSPFF